METKTINYFDTPYERRKGNLGFIKFMDGIIKASNKRKKLETVNENKNDKENANNGFTG